MNFLITGANSGIGFELLKILSQNKRNNFFIISKINTNIKQFKNVKFYKMNLNSEENTKKIAKKIIKDSSGKIDVIVCNAAEGTFGPVNKVNINDFKKNYITNFFSHLILIKSILPYMIKKNNGHIVNIASGAGIYGFENSSSYALGKSSLQILIETIYEENLKNNIFAKNIFPGLTKTNFINKNKSLLKRNAYKIQGKNKKLIANIIAKNIFSKKLNIFCQTITRVSFLIKIFPFLNSIKKIIE